MTDQPSNIVPFGKYKGRLIEEVLVDDPGYLQWLAGQEWFRSKFAVLYQVIINRGAEAEETPEHNALQVRFLEDDFCLRFLRSTRHRSIRAGRVAGNPESRCRKNRGKIGQQATRRKA
jgi:uncharacterized protein (DUF3820 family)